jgi:hypothetical protein
MRKAGTLLVVGAFTLAAACGDDEEAFPTSSAASSSGDAAGGDGSGGEPATGATGSGGTGNAEPECPHTGADVLDPSTLPACPPELCAGGARCLPTSLIPMDFLEQLGDCDATNKCVPDDFIKSGGDFIPPTCTSIGGAEGRCLSECLPQLAAQAASLPVDVCGEFQRCAPCYDPITYEETGACSLSCDPGPTMPPVMLPKCCNGIGTCVPMASVPPDQAALLPPDTCPQDDNMYVCAPDVFVSDPNFAPTPCETDILIGGGDPGVCLPGCLVTGLQGQLLGQSTCDTDWKCVPCNDPLTGDPTGACEI